MRFLVFSFLLLLLGCNTIALKSPLRRPKPRSESKGSQPKPPVVLSRSASPTSPFLNNNTSGFLVNGSALPDVPFDVGESYAGQLPIGDNSDGKLFFWFFPSTAAGNPKEIIIWLNGGPGCSSLDGLVKENGPFTWGSGTPYPVQNPWSWHHLSNVIWVEYPVGTGFSTGTVTATSEEEIAQDFRGFWKNFVDAFEIHGYKIYIAGESYAGHYCPFLASSFVDANDTNYFNIKGMQIYDPEIADFTLAQELSVHYHVEYWRNLFPFNDTTWANIRGAAKDCGMDEYMDHYMSFPPKGQQPVYPPGYLSDGSNYDFARCDVFDIVFNAILEINPYWNDYQIGQLGPLPWDVLGFPYSSPFTWPGTQIYFNRTDVKKAIHAPDVEWAICASFLDRNVFVDGIDTSLPSIIHAIPNVVDYTSNVQIIHGAMDYVLIPNGTLLAIQNMTWGGKLGFQSAPKSPLFVPHHPNPDARTASGQGVLGVTHTERGLTWAEVVLTGHMVPTWQSAVAFRMAEYLLGRVHSLHGTQPLSNYPDAPQPPASSLGGSVGPLVGVKGGGDSP